MPIFTTGRTIPIEVKYAELKLKDGSELTVVVETEEQEKRFGDRVKSLKTQWAVPNWRDNHDAIRQSTVVDPMTGNKGVDIQQYKTICLEKFLKAWDVTDEKGQPMKPTKELVMSLDFTIARALVDQFINRHIPTEDELGN